jgi:hypothetical protein
MIMSVKVTDTTFFLIISLLYYVISMLLSYDKGKILLKLHAVQRADTR